MPSKAILTEKQSIVNELAERLQSAQGGVLVDYSGINVEKDTQLRRELREANVHYTVVKNTLTRLALDKTGLGAMDDVLNGTTALATSTEDPLVPLYMVTEQSKKLGDIFNIKAAFVEGQVLTPEQQAELSVIPSKDALYSQVLGTMLAPITSLAVALGQVVEKGGVSLAAEESAEEAAEAPAEESAEAHAEPPAAE